MIKTCSLTQGKIDKSVLPLPHESLRGATHEAAKANQLHRQTTDCEGQTPCLLALQIFDTREEVASLHSVDTAVTSPSSPLPGMDTGAAKMNHMHHESTFGVKNEPLAYSPFKYSMLLQNVAGFIWGKSLCAVLPSPKYFLVLLKNSTRLSNSRVHIHRKLLRHSITLRYMTWNRAV